MTQDITGGASHHVPSSGWPEIPSSVQVLQPSPQAAESPRVPPRKVLLLEDDPAQLQLLRQQIQSLGLEALCTSTIQEARRLVRHSPPELAILDVHVPDGSGLDLCREIDEDPQLMGLPVIVLSASTETNILRSSRAAGGCFFISKPYDPNVLLTIIENAIGSLG